MGLGGWKYHGWLGPYPSGSIISASHTWTHAGVYEIRAKIKGHGAESNWSEPHIITIVENQPPEKPIIKGPVVGSVGVAYNFTVVITDPEARRFFSESIGEMEIPLDGLVHMTQVRK